MEATPLVGRDFYDEVIKSVSDGPSGTVFRKQSPQKIYFETPVFRQDASGLYVHYSLFAASNGDLPPEPEGSIATTPSGPLTGESTILRYPLHIGSRWVGRDGTEAIVEGSEILQLPIGRVHAFRVRSGSTSRWVREWYSTCGLLRIVEHREGPLYDRNGQIVGTRIYDQTFEVISLDLKACGKCTACR